MARKPHWLGRTNGGEVPDTICYVGVSSEKINTPVAIFSWTEAGRMVCAEKWRYVRDEADKVDHVACGAAGDFWTFLVAGLSRRKMNWIYFRDLARGVTLLRGWELIEDGAIRYQSACLQDPPIWIRCAIGGRHCLLCDSRNYGDDALSVCIDPNNPGDKIDRQQLGERVFWETAAQAECRSVREFIEPIHRSIVGAGGCGWKPTISGLAWSLYRRHFIPEVMSAWDEENPPANVE